MAKQRKSQQTDPLAKWLALGWDRPERSYNPDVRDFLAGVLDYPKDRVITEDAGGGGYPDIKLLTTEKIAWVVGDLKKEDTELTTVKGREKLWEQKCKYVEGLTRYVLFPALAQIDATVYAMFGLTDAEKTHIETRLASFPLNKLQPRYPWQTVKPRPIKAYTSDRFT